MNNRIGGTVMEMTVDVSSKTKKGKPLGGDKYMMKSKTNHIRDRQFTPAVYF